ncbi:MAG: tyrosine-protein phosphatase [Kofleriaceae bacterium]
MLVNFRPLPDQIAPPALFRAAASMAAFAAADRVVAMPIVHAVIDLRTDEEVGRNAFTFGNAAHVRRPLAARPLRSAGGAVEDADRTEWYVQMLIGFVAEIVDVLSEVASRNKHSCVIVCGLGKDRTGVVSAALLTVAGVARPHIFEDFARSEASLPPALPIERRRAPARTLESALDIVEQRCGGLIAHLRRNGLTELTEAALRHRFRGVRT